MGSSTVWTCISIEMDSFQHMGALVDSNYQLYLSTDTRLNLNSPNGGSRSADASGIVFIVWCGVSPLGSIIVESREGWIWYHASEPGKMQFWGPHAGQTAFSCTHAHHNLAGCISN